VHEEGPFPLDLYAFGRGLAYLGALALVGVCVHIALIPRWRATDDDDRSLAARSLDGAWTVAIAAPALLLVAHLIRAWGQVRSFLDPLEPFTWAAARPVLFQTAWGRGWEAQVGVALLALPVAWLGRRHATIGVAFLGAAALGVAATSPLTGHAAEHPWGRTLGVGLHAVHLIGGGMWLGTLFTMVVAGLRPALSLAPPDPAAVARMVAMFSPIALAGAGLAVTAGVLMSYAYVGDLGSLVGTTYGRTLLIKVGLLIVTMALGAWNWRRLSPRLGSKGAARALARSATFELLIGLLLVGTTAVLVALPAPKV
jgi:copper transport protein